jgi:murein DD-endopeptidase MepM/ murein hydrolase activator NlpD
VAGTLTSPFAYWHPLGIDLAMPIGNEIRAAKSGVVKFVGGDLWVSYGLHVKLEHGDGWESTYAHLNSTAVESGQFVNEGDLLGYSGNTGNSTGPHLHFEIRYWGEPVDPLNYIQ